MDQELIMMPFVHRKSTKNSQISDIENSIIQQTRAWSKFNNRRNTSRIQHYFQSLHNKRITLSYNTAAVILCIIGIWIAILLIDSYYLDSYQKQSESILEVFYCTLYEHVIHTLRDPTFFSDFFPGFFCNPYKYPLSAESAPIYAQSFLIAYQFTGGYVTSWKAGDINGRLVGLDFDENEPTVAFLQFCNGTNQPIYYWESSFYEYNKSFPFEGGVEFSTENVITADWLISGYNATGPLISELYIKRTDNNFIPLYTLVFPAIDTATSTTDFVFSFDLTLIKIQQFLRTLNVSRNSRLAVTTNENILIAVTGDDQPIDAFNNEIVTKEISELGDPVWSCVSKEEAFARHENFSTRCTITVFDEEDSDDIQNVTIAYYVFQGTVSVGKVTTWKFIAAVENTLDSKSAQVQDLYQDKSPTISWERNFISPFVTGVVVTAVVCFILVVLYLFTPSILRLIDRKSKNHNKYERIEKQKEKLALKKSNTDILSSFGWKYSNHTRPIGILNAISELKIIQESSSCDEKAKLIAQKAIFEILQNSFGCPIFNESDFFARIDNLKVRRRLREIFGSSYFKNNDDDDESDNFDENDDANIDDQEIMRRRRSSLSLKKTTFDAIPVSNSGIPSKHQSTVYSQAASKSSESSEKNENDFLQLNSYKEENDFIQSAVSIISATNNYFSQPEFDEVLQKFFSDIPKEIVFVTTSSFFFTDELLRHQSQLESALYDKDMQLSLYIAELSFNLAMKSRRIKEEGKVSSISEQLFLNDDQIIFKIARSILYEFYKTQTKDTIETNNDAVASLNYQDKSSNINDDYDKDASDDDYDSRSYQESESKNNSNNSIIDSRWTKICEITFEILKSTPISSHMEVITKAQLFLTSKLIETKLTKCESMILLKLLYVTSMISFLFEKKNAKIGFSLLGFNKKKEEKDNNNNNDNTETDVEIHIDDPNDNIEVNGIFGCLFENLVYPEMSALNQIFGSKFVRYSWKNINCL